MANGALGQVDMPSSGYNPARVVIDPNDPDYLKKLGLVGAMEGHHEIATNDQKPGQSLDQPADTSGSLPMGQVKAPIAQAPRPKSNFDIAAATPTAVGSLMDKAKGIQNKPLRALGEIGTGLLTGAEAVGESLFPNVAEKIPGTFENKEQKMAIGQAQDTEELARGQQDIEKQKVQATEEEKKAELATRTAIAEQNNAIRQKIDELNNATKANDVDKMIQGHKDIADLTNKFKILHDQQQFNEFKTTDQYKRWKEQLDADTKLRVAQLTANKAPAAMLQTAEFASGGLNQLSDAQAAMKQLQDSGVMGSLPANKVEDWIFGKGLVDPSLPAETREAIGRLRAALSYTSSAAMRAHTGRTSQDIYNDFKSTLGPGQDWSALNGAIEETTKMLGQYSQAASTENIQNLRGGKPASTGGTPKKGDKKTFPNGKVGTWDGKGYVAD